jgi:hypothetical protein
VWAASPKGKIGEVVAHSGKAAALPLAGSMADRDGMLDEDRRVGDSFEATQAGWLTRAGISTAAGVQVEGMPLRLRARGHRRRLTGQ